MLRSSIDPVRHALLAALGLAALACGPDKGTSADDDSSASDSATSDSTANTSNATTTTATDPTTSPTTTGAPAGCAGTITVIDPLYAEPPVPSGF